MLPDSSKELYGLVKRLGDIKVGIHTVFHVSSRNKLPRDLSMPRQTHYWGPKLDPSTIANLQMKFNLKLGDKSANQVLSASNKERVLIADTIVVGYDVTHPEPGSPQGAQSIAAMVSSVDSNYAQWPSTILPNPRPAADTRLWSERVLYLAEMLTTRLNDYKKRNGKLPRRLVIYRDGLSEAQFEMCKTLELPQIQQAITILYVNNSKPELLLICTVKRHHARFYPHPEGTSNSSVLDSRGNRRPGHAVYDKITYGNNNDFFLISHETLQGTARPVHYVVLHNTIAGLSISDIVFSSNRMCYTFQRATRSVSLVPAAYYADLAADRARHYVRDQYSPKYPIEFNEAKFIRDLQLHPDVAGRMLYI